ncbi:MAG: outer membrane beta-barrel protein [Nitrospirae bacterium]|nr:outer membrane beta-barrel protein [Nitrospirota bacterium]
MAGVHARLMLQGLFFLLFSALIFAPYEARADWSAIAETKALYTDNVFEHSSARRLSLSEDPSQPAIVSVKKPSDIVWEPSLDVRHTSTPTNFGQTEVSFKAHGFIYTDNPLFNHGNYRMQVRQALDPETSVLLRYRYVPNLFLGPNNERRTGRRLEEEERVTSHIWRLQLERRLTESFTATLVGRYGLRQFNEAFAERDTTFWTSGPQLEWAINSWLRLATAYLYERGLSDGRQEIQFKDDVSYRQHFASLGATAWMNPSLSLTVGYAYRRKMFTSEIVGDSNRGVVDTTHQGSAELRYEMNRATAVTLGFQRSQRSSNVGTRDFFNTNTSLGVQYQF